MCLQEPLCYSGWNSNEGSGAVEHKQLFPTVYQVIMVIHRCRSAVSFTPVSLQMSLLHGECLQRC